MVIRSIFKCSLFAIIIGLTFFSSKSATAQTVSALDLGASNVNIYKTSKQRIYGFGISATGGDATVTALTTQPTGGTYTATDILGFELYYNDVDDFATATLVGTSGAPSGAGEIINFGSFSQTITGDGFDRYFYIAANVAAGATSGNDFSIPFLDVSNFTFTTAVTFTSSLGPSGTKTIQNAITYTSVPTANTTNTSITSNIELDFNANLNLNSVHNGTINPDDIFDDNIKIIGSQSGQFRGVFSFGADNSIVIFNPSISFKAGEEVTVIVNSFVTGAAGEAAAARSFRFIAASGPFEGGYKERTTANIAGMADGTFDWGDYDNDGDLDLIVVGFDPSYTASATIYNNVNGVFTDIGAGLTGVFFSAAAWGDYDSDGDLDVVVAGVDDSGSMRSTTIYRNDGGGTFTDIGAGLQGVDYSDLDWGDYDNDGDLDLVVIGRYFDSPFFGSDLASSTIYRNDGGDVFTDIGAGLQPLNNGSVNWGDYDADGDLDLVMNGYDGAWSTRYTIIYDNNDGIFTDHLAGLPNVSWGDSDWGDYDNDGDLDLLLAGGAVGLSITSIYDNTGGVFTDINAGLPLVPEGSVRWGDYDGDGNLDVVLTGTDSFGDEITHIYRNSGGGVFTDINAGLATVYSRGLADFADFDGDGDLDILVAGESSTSPSGTSAVLYENTILTPFITTWKTDNPGSSNDNQITIPTTGTGYFYNVNWGDGMTDTGVTGGITHTYATPGTYTVSITGAFPRIFFNAGFTFSPPKDSDKLLTVEQWGDVAWTSMNNAFAGCENLRINALDAPNLSGVTDMSRMFFNAIAMNDDINHWDVSTITSMLGLFRDAEAFNQPLDTWDVSNVTSMEEMFFFARAFNQDLNTWVVDNVTNMRSMFGVATAFNGDVSAWHVDNVTDLSGMFAATEAFNRDISSWQITNATNLSAMFSGAIAFNQDISTKIGGGNNGGDAWDTNGVLNMASLFRDADAFSQPITNWDVSTVTDMNSMFANHDTFNQDITGWVVDNVTEMRTMFSRATAFNQDISIWHVTSVRDFNSMFDGATSFDQPIGSWTLNTTLNIDMRGMFSGASSFNQDLSSWNVTRLTQAFNMFNNSGMSVANYDLLLESWAAQPVNSGVSFGAQGLFYCSAQAARDILTNAPNNWFITDGGSKCISVFDGPTMSDPEILNGQPQAIDYGSTSTLKTRNFTLINNQGITINNVQITNPDPGFPTTIVFPSIPAGGTQTFSVSLTGPVGTYIETITITSPDVSGSFQFDVTGEKTATPEPEIAVFEGATGSGTPILDGQALAFDLGSTIRGNSLVRDVSIRNIGDADLNISDISFFGGTEFQLVSIPPSFIPVDGTEVIQIQINGTNAGQFLETLVIASDDTDEPTFSFGVYAEIIGPDIWVVDGLAIFSDPEILNGQITPVDFGSGSSGSDIVRQLIITNATPSNMLISNISISGTAFSFTLAAPFPVAGESDGIYDEILFEITLSGAFSGTFNETVTITSDDETDPIFTFPITGTIVPGACASPPTASVGIIADICEGSTIALSGSIGGSATVSTWSSAGDGSFDNASSLSALYTPGPNDISNGTVSLSLSTDDPDGAGPCNAATALAFVSINQAATVDAGIDQTICITDIASLSGTMGSAANNPIWSTSGTGSFTSPNTLSSDYTPSPSDISSGSVTLTLTVDASGVCPPVTDQLILTLSQPITAGSPSVQGNVGQTTLIDVVASSGTTSANVSSVTITQSPSQGVATLNPDNSINYVPNTGTIGADSFEYEICNGCGLCDQAIVSIDILNAPPIFTAPTTPPVVAPGQSIVLSIPTLVTDPNGNLDLSSFSNFNSSANASSSYDPNTGDLTLDYSNANFSSAQDNISFTICDQLNSCTDVMLQIDLDGEITVFNGISPNNDGDNDFFMIQNIQFVEPANKVSIYNRWGDLIFDMENYDSTNPDRRFNGVSNKGKEVTSGVYFYKVGFGSGRDELTGYLTLKK